MRSPNMRACKANTRATLHKSLRIPTWECNKPTKAFITTSCSPILLPYRRYALFAFLVLLGPEPKTKPKIATPNLERRASPEPASLSEAQHVEGLVGWCVWLRLWARRLLGLRRKRSKANQDNQSHQPNAPKRSAEQHDKYIKAERWLWCCSGVSESSHAMAFGRPCCSRTPSFRATHDSTPNLNNTLKHKSLPSDWKLGRPWVSIASPEKHLGISENLCDKAFDIAPSAGLVGSQLPRKTA